jgi:hypothetical protein
MSLVERITDSTANITSGCFGAILSRLTSANVGRNVALGERNEAVKRSRLLLELTLVSWGRSTYVFINQRSYGQGLI